MQLTLIRHATLVLEVRGRRILVDPMLDPAGTEPPIEDTANPVRNPIVELPMPVDEIVAGLDAVIITHRHRDHLDGTAEERLPRDVPVFCQPEDESALLGLGLQVHPVDASLDWEGLVLHRTPGRHGFGAIAEALAPVSGFVLDTVYLAGDTVWYPRVEEIIDRHRPRVAVVNAGGARFLDGDHITMTPDDVAEVVARVPTVVAAHMEAINHCHVTRAELAAACPGVLIPADGELLEL